MCTLNSINRRCYQEKRLPLRTRQRGVVLLIALIILVAMTLGGIALIRSTSTTNLIAGNLAFKQASINAAEMGSEAAINYLRGQGSKLWDSNVAKGYSAVVFDPRPGESWGDFWSRLQKGTDADAMPKPIAINTTTFGENNANYRTSYVIHRLCDGEGVPNLETTYCVKPPSYSPSGCSDKAGKDCAQFSEIYYRVTVRVDGPRNTESYIQTIVAVTA